MRYPFRYYGRQPLDWFEGANLGHLFELVFVETPTAEQKTQIARVFEVMLASGPAEPSDDPWLFSGRSPRSGSASDGAMERGRPCRASRSSRSPHRLLPPGERSRGRQRRPETLP